MRICVDADRLRDTANEIQQQITVLRQNMNDIECLVNSLNGEWQGDAEKAYASKILYIRKEYLEVEKFFRDYSSLLLRASEEYIQYEANLASRIMNV